MTAAILALILDVLSPSPLLCEVHPWVCVPCGGPGMSPCQAEPQAGEWLCCSAAGICVIETPQNCDTGIYGWCDDVVTETLRSGIEVATCEDPEED